jgi:hypothetical protein
MYLWSFYTTGLTFEAQKRAFREFGNIPKTVNREKLLVCTITLTNILTSTHLDKEQITIAQTNTRNALGTRLMENFNGQITL